MRGLDAFDWVRHFAAQSAGGGDNIGLYTMVVGLASAFSASVVAYFQSRVTRMRRDEDLPRRRRRGAMLEPEALALWIATHHPDVDPRKIRTGYETMDEVRRAV